MRELERLSELERALDRLGRLAYAAGGEQRHAEFDVDLRGVAILAVTAQHREPLTHDVDRLGGASHPSQGVPDLRSQASRVPFAPEIAQPASGVLEQLERVLVATVDQRHLSGRLEQVDALLLAGGEIDRGPVCALGGLGCADRRGPLSAATQRGDRLGAELERVGVVGGGAVRLEVVRGQDLGHVLALVGEGVRQVVSRREVPGLPLALGQGLVGDRPEQGLAESVLPTIRRVRVGSDGQHLLANEAGEDRLGGPLRHARKRLHRREREVAPEHGHRSDELALVEAEGIEPGAEERDQAGRDVELAELAGEDQRPVALDQDAAIGERPHRLDRV